MYKHSDVNVNSISFRILFLFYLIISIPGRAQVTAEVDEEVARARRHYNESRFDSAAISYEKAFYLSNQTEVALLSRAGLYFGLAGDHNKAFLILHRAADAGWSNYYALNDPKFDSLRKYSVEWTHLIEHVKKRDRVNQKVFYWGWYYGLISLLFLINLFMYFRLKESAFLFYSLFLFFIAQWTYYNNTSYVYYFSKIMFWMQRPDISGYFPLNSTAMLFSLFFTLFASKLLNLKNSLPRMFIYFRITVVVLLILVVLSFLIRGNLAQLLVMAGFFILMAVIITSFILGIKLLRKKYRPARFFVIAVSSLAILSVSSLLNSAGFNIPLPEFDGVFNGMDIALIAFYILLAFALGDRMKILQDEKAEAQEKALEVLEEKVVERTAEIIEQKRVIEGKQKDILDSIHYAKRIQQSLLPSLKYIDKTINRLINKNR